MTTFRFPTSTVLAGLSLYAGLLLCVWVYWAGLNGPFLFDDSANLSALGEFGKVDTLQNLLLYLDSRVAGPTGRPISMLSFLLNANTWPAHSWSFKYTNLMIHLLNGTLLYWVVIKLFRFNILPSISDRAEWLALSVALLWLLHPFHVTTTLYVVQRMTLLSALFSLCGILAYLHGRQAMQSHPIKGYAWMVVALVPCTLLALLSKENGVLLPVLIGVIEFTVLRQQSRLLKHPAPTVSFVFFGVPALAVMIYVSRFLFQDQTFIVLSRGFTAFQRGLTEGRVLLHYLNDLLIPKLYSGSLLNDDFPLSTSLLAPPTTALALFAILVLIFFAWIIRKSYPLLSLAILFFFVGHALESTVVPLDVYYEHRNYLPSIFLFLPIAYAAQTHARLTATVFVVVLLIFTGFTAAKSKLWSNELELVLLWGSQHPDSIRAQRSAANVYFEHGLHDKALQTIVAATEKHPKDVKLRLHRTVLYCMTNQPDQVFFTDTVRLIETSPVFFDSHISDMLEQLTNLGSAGQCGWLRQDELTSLTNALMTNPAIKSDRTHELTLTHLKGLIALNNHNKAEALAMFAHTLELSAEPKTGLLEASLLATHGYYPDALAVLSATENRFFNKQSVETGVLTKRDYLAEIQHLRQQIEQDIKQPSLPAKPESAEKFTPK